MEALLVDPRVIDASQIHVFQPKPVDCFPCRICGSQGATERSDGLCWVCQRLKISAWRESEQAEAASE